jgi:hypothetical protein
LVITTKNYVESSTFGHVTGWNKVIKKEARGRNDADLGEVLEVKDDIVVTERGTLNKKNSIFHNQFHMDLMVIHCCLTQQKPKIRKYTTFILMN